MQLWNKLQNSSNPRLKLISTSVLKGKNLTDALSDVQPGSVLDFRYFVTKVEPILAKPGADGKACVFCHASHVIFKLEPPNAEGVFSDQDSKENYKYAMRVVDITDPDKSLIADQTHAADRQRRQCRRLSGHAQRRPALAWKRIERSIPDHSGVDPRRPPRERDYFVLEEVE